MANDACALVLHTNDLRLVDHRPLNRACNQFETVVGMVVIDPTCWSDTKAGFAKMSPRRVQWYLDAISGLRLAYRERGGELIVRIGNAASEVSKVCRNIEAVRVFAQRAKTTEELTRLEQIQTALGDCPCEWVWNDVLIDPELLPTPAYSFPRSFSGFRKKFEQRCVVPMPSIAPERLGLPTIDAGEIPSLTDLGFDPVSSEERSTIAELQPGELGAWRQLRSYVWEGEHIKRYKETRNGMLHWEESSKLSPYLALGLISPRSVYHEVSIFEAKRVENQSTYWLKYELLWREYFHALALFCGDRLFYLSGVKNRFMSWRDDVEMFQRWTTGNTGCPIVDACMRELAATGFCSNRGRQLVASFFVKYLNLDWRLGAAWFEHHLVDYDACSNWGNWQYLAGVGTDSQDRVFSMLKQSERYDPDAAFIRRWMPELAHLSTLELLRRNPVGPEGWLKTAASSTC